MYPYINVFGLTIQSYYICAAAAGALGITLAVLYLRKTGQGIWAFFLPVIAAAAALAGARLLNCILNPAAFSEEFPVWTLSYRKLSLMGGLAAGIVVTVLYCLLRRESMGKVADAFAVPAAAGTVLLKIGCFLNGCCFGKPTESPFGMIFPANASKYSFINSLKIVSAKSQVVHPTQLYEIAGAIIAGIAAVVLTRIFRLKEGSRAAIFAVLFTAARWIVLPLREFPYEKEMITVFYPCLYAAMIMIAAGYLAVINRRHRS